MKEIKGLDRHCVECHTTRTPMWRGGPSGPRSLCNACGIKYRKKNRGLLGLEKWGSKKCVKNHRTGNNNNLSEHHRGSIASQMMMMKTESEKNRTTTGEVRLRLQEEEEAAILLMALSCDVFG